ncbi:MAG: hypothetical protein Kow0042_20540 [Calditrichia bacterium]
MKYMMLVAVFIYVSLSLAATDVKKIIKNVQKKYQDVESIYVDFKQVNRFKITGVTNEIYGTLWLAPDNKFRLETEDQTIVSDGQTFWRFNKMENQVLVDYAKKSEQDIFLSNFLFSINDQYYSQIISESKESGSKIYEVKLTPKNQDESFFNYIKVWLEDKSWKIRKVQYVDYNENEFEYLIEKMKLDEPVSETKFVFTPAEGVEVIDLR